MEADDPPDELPKGRDWTKDVRVGVHAYPSMNHLHIHILSVDRHSIFMKKPGHYNSFNTKFFVPLEDFPLTAGDDRYQPDMLKKFNHGDLICWKCGKNFARRFARLKEHLDKEFLEWRYI
jgi:aprataxin